MDSPRHLTNDSGSAQRLWEHVPRLPRHVWGRDELHTGEMWNSNSIIAWLITRAGIAIDEIRPPLGGRAPGWHAGIVAAGGD